MNVPDIYFEPAYGKLCELIQGGSADDFVWESPSGTIRNMFIRRPLPKALDPSGTYTDLATPYGYGGPVIVSLTGDRATLVREYDEAFSAYCRSQNIVCEFVRFHPILRNDRDVRAAYKVIYKRHTVVTPLEGVEDVLKEHYSKSCRKRVRRLLRGPYHVDVLEHPSDLTSFTDIYYETMEHNEAAEQYFFPRSYFDAMLRLLKDYMIVVNILNDEDILIASGIYFVYGDLMHAHLSGTREAFRDESPSYLLRYHAMNWGIRNGMRLFHHGGGTSDDPNDPLLAFKKKFSKADLLDFYVGQKIFMPDVYEAMVEKNGVTQADYFPLYRA